MGEKRESIILWSRKIATMYISIMSMVYTSSVSSEVNALTETLSGGIFDGRGDKSNVLLR